MSVRHKYDYYPGGSIMPGRSFSSNTTRYGFMGMEKDDELKGSGNSYDFGNRIYDSRLNRWLTLDPMQQKYPDWSPYVAFGDNPIFMLDPDGRFLISVHQRITQNAVNGMNSLFSTNYSVNFSANQSFKRALTRGVASPDYQSIYGPDVVTDKYAKPWHFDNLSTISEIDAAWRAVEERENQIFAKYNKLRAPQELGFRLGQVLHTVQDFYSHSNYVELYVSVYGEAENLDEIPLFEEAMSDPKFQQFAEVLNKKLKTGTYHTHLKPGEGPGSHDDLNKDQGKGVDGKINIGGFFELITSLIEPKVAKEPTYNSKAAENLATRGSKKRLKDYQKRIEKINTTVKQLDNKKSSK